MKRRLSTYIVPIVVLAFAAVGYAAITSEGRGGGYRKETPDGHEVHLGGRPRVNIDPVVVQNMGLRVAPAESRTVYRNIRAPGRVVIPEDRLSVVNLRYGGWIERIFADESGVEVKKGQRLFSIYSPEVLEAREDYLLARSLDGENSTRTRSAMRKLTLLGVGRGGKAPAANSARAQRTVTVTAPRAGYVLEKNVVLGSRVMPGEDLYTIGDLGGVWIEAEVYEHDARWIEDGLEATAELPSRPGESLTAVIERVYPTLDERTRTMTVRLSMDNPDVFLRPGMLATVRIKTREKAAAVTVPSGSVIYSGEQRLVFVSEGAGRYAAREVETGLVSDDGHTEILAGLDSGERVVTSGQFLLDSESRIMEAAAKMLDEGLEEIAHDHLVEHNDGNGGKGVTYYTCPMHPEVVRRGPGSCPSCGMDLVEKKR